MERKLINWVGLLGIISFISYALAVIVSPIAYPGYNWMEQAVSDLSAIDAPSRALWDQLSALYGSCGLVSVTCTSVSLKDAVYSPLPDSMQCLAGICSRDLTSYRGARRDNGIDYIPKPFERNVLVAKVQALLHQKPEKRGLKPGNFKDYKGQIYFLFS